ncbi:MAG: acyl-CoA dehydrogenase, partial [Thermoplasmata archaeon]|nr:acyl-CoA dehydrogenase family protein [Thermoplasmata archaeon]NIS12412.1 acyl-CoA dehydrogenase family protein [Thermoplasmata archaeon]NIS20331.1 acyl-CoA dehydrogenase family protein [Thermoplasmata archaeon]NIT77674.1 acyl-CoA dehydrogenase family protein [Thermoplasmata archaeon]NIU49419.1 acyl-CoA dehydrogenase family protein [Thermoplasmata archaeon]
DFNFSQEQDMVRKTVREYAEAELAPIVEDLDRWGHIPPEVLQELASIGLLGVTTESQFGGIDADPV